MKPCKGWQNFKNEVLIQHMPVVCFGAGMMGVYIERFFIKENIWDNVICFLDNNPRKEGTSIGQIQPKKVLTVKNFKREKAKKFILLITCVTYAVIIEQLDKISEWDNVYYYIYPELNYEVVKNVSVNMELIRHRTEEIPRIIHYCWFGRGKKSALIQECINSWKAYCPDYMIIEWNEDNYEISKNRYAREAYAQRKWAYVTDYVRMDVLYRYGGIYLDADVEILKNIDILLTQKAFIAYGEWPTVNSGAGIGSVKQHPLIKEMRDNPRGKISFLKADGNCNMTQNCVYETNVLDKYGFTYDFRMQYIEDMLILSPEYMATASIIGKNAYITEKTLTIHHNGESWADETRRNEVKQTRDYNI